MKSLSYSEIKLWYHNKDAYYKRYILGQEEEPTKAQLLGKIVHAALENQRYDWQKELKKNGYSQKISHNVRTVIDKMVPTLIPPVGYRGRKLVKQREAVLTATTKYGLRLLTIFDAVAWKERRTVDYKTFQGHEAWSQYIVDDWMQGSFEAWVWRLNYHSYFTNMEVDAINLSKGTVKRFHTVRSSRDIDYVEGWANQAVREIKDAGLWELRLSKNERIKQQTQLIISYPQETSTIAN